MGHGKDSIFLEKVYIEANKGLLKLERIKHSILHSEKEHGVLPCGSKPYFDRRTEKEMKRKESEKEQRIKGLENLKDELERALTMLDTDLAKDGRDLLEQAIERTKDYIRMY